MPDTSDTAPGVFDKILAPVIPLIRQEACKMGNDADTYRLSFSFFTLNIFRIESNILYFFFLLGFFCREGKGSVGFFETTPSLWRKV